MPELVANGPRIPASLLNEADSAGVVFFCGAGVSAGRESGLPSFAKLVKHVYEKNAMVPNGVEREALECDEPNENRRRPPSTRHSDCWNDRTGWDGGHFGTQSSNASRHLHPVNSAFTRRSSSWAEPNTASA